MCLYYNIQDKTAEIHGFDESQTKFDLGSERTGFALWLKLCLRLTTRLLTLLKDAPQGKAGSYSSCFIIL
jgi:hypothetical protein